MQAGELWVKLGLNKSDFDKGLKDAGGQASSFGEVMKTATGTAIGFAAVKIGENIVSGLKNALAAGIEYNSYMENSSVAWETLLGSGEKAKKMLSDIEAFAAKTPFEKLQVDQMAKYMNNAGYEGQALFDQLTKIGDMGGAFNIQGDSLVELARQYSQVKQAGVAYTEDLNILADRGVPIYKALAEQLGINVADVKKWASEGKISADVYEKAMNGIASSVAGGMDKQSKTFTGMISTFKDNLSSLAGMATKGLFEGLKTQLQGAIDFVGRFTAGFQEGGLLGAIKAVAGESAPVWQYITETIQKAYNAIKPHLDGLWLIIQQNLIPIIQGLWGMIQAAMPGIQAIFEVVAPIVVEAINGIIDIIGAFIQIIKGIYDAISPGLNLVIEIFNAVANAIKAAFDWLSKWNTEPMQSKTATMTINEYKNALQGPGTNAAGTDHWRGGLTWVNEQGGELMNLPNGTQIIPHDVSMEMARNAGKGGTGKSITQQFYGPVYMRDPNEAKQNLQSAMFAAAF